MNIFVATSARDEVLDKYGDICTELLEEVAGLADTNLVFGAYGYGLMGKTYEIFKKHKKKIIGVAPLAYKSDFKSVPCDEEIITTSSMTRLEKIYEKSDVLLFLPGGIGTYSELFSCLEERKSNPGKTIILYNVGFFFSPMLEEMYKLYQQGFLDKNLGEYILISNNKEEIIQKLKESEKNE